MVSLVSSWSNNAESVPPNYVMPLEKRPGLVSICKNITVIDLGQAANNGRADLVDQIIKAGKEFGNFQVINHGVAEDLMNDAMSLYKEFFALPVEDKASIYSNDSSKRSRLHTSSRKYDNEEIHYWKDTLTHPCLPVEEHMQSWPEKPARYRDVVAAYSAEVNKMGLKILDLISEGLGLEEGYFAGELSKSHVMAVNHYPRCPNPSLALGIGGHCDPNLITILQQEVYGLQVFKDGQWIGVDVIPNAFVINMCYQMQIISNGKLKSAEHRGVTNSTEARTSVVTFLGPSTEAVIEPAKALVSEDSPPVFRSFQYVEFIQNYLPLLDKQLPHRETALGRYELQA